MAERVNLKPSFEDEFGTGESHHNDTQFKNGGISGRHAYSEPSGAQYYPVGPPRDVMPKYPEQSSQFAPEHEQLRLSA